MVFALFCVMFLMISCGDGSSSDNNSVTNFGKLGGECYPNRTCDKGFICDAKHNVCLKDPGNPDNGSDKSDSDNVGKTDTTPEQPDDGDSTPADNTDTSDQTDDSDTSDSTDDADLGDSQPDGDSGADTGDDGDTTDSGADSGSDTGSEGDNSNLNTGDESGNQAQAGEIGAACTSDSQCTQTYDSGTDGQEPVCLFASYGFPNGYCTFFGDGTDSAACDSTEELFYNFGGSWGGNGLCLHKCTKPSDCRKGYRCSNKIQACLPDCKTAGYECVYGKCDTTDGVCLEI